MTESIEVLRKRSREASAELWAAEQKERDKENATLIGKCFRYRNSYSVPKENERWWLYIKILKVEDGALRALKFEVDYEGRIKIDPNEYMGNIFEGYHPISAATFNRAWQETVTAIHQIDPEID